MKKDIIIYVNSLPDNAAEAVRSLEKERGETYRILLLRDSRMKHHKDVSDVDIVLDCDFSNPSKIAKALLGYQDQLLAITCRSESNIARFIDVIPHVPYLRTPSAQSLVWATDKYEMRKRFKIFDPKHTPKFTKIESSSKAERMRIIEKVGFPMVIKPTNLAASTLVSICYHEEELEKTLKKTFRKINAAYQKSNRKEVPQVMAEEFIEGDMYSVDSYVNTRGEVYHCPMVRVKTGKDVGHDDFYNYLRITPTNLKKESIDAAHERVEIGIHALGLRNTTTHTELIRADGDWKIVEIGPRIGGFRHELHKLSCDIDHALNDIKIRIPQKPSIPKKCKGYAAVMRYYPSDEGTIEQINGLKKIKEIESFKELTVKAKVGDKSYFAKNGGKGIFELTLYNTDRSKLLADIRRVEKNVQVKVKNRQVTTK